MATKKTRKQKIIRPKTLPVGWYTNPEMVGHHYAIETYRSAWSLKSIAKSKVQKALLETSIDFSDTRWTYWSNISQKDISLLKHSLKALSKGESLMNVYMWVDARHSMLKSDLLRYLEFLAYHENMEVFKKDYAKGYAIFGMSKADAYKRCENYMKQLVDNYGYTLP